MEKNVLIDFETFSEFPNKYLKVNKDSSYYYIKMQSENYVAKSKFDNISLINCDNVQKLKMVKSYYDVRDGSFVLKTISICDMYDKNEMFIENEYEIYPLSYLLNIKCNDKYYLTKDDIEVLLNFDKQNSKVYTKKSGK